MMLARAEHQSKKCLKHFYDALVPSSGTAANSLLNVFEDLPGGMGRYNAGPCHGTSLARLVSQVCCRQTLRERTQDGKL